MNDKYIKLECVNLHYASSSFRETSLKAWFLNLWKQNTRKNIVDIHALKDINLKLSAGERVGLLGHNGAGKSTLLKLIAGLYPASSGSREVSGKITSLFELGLGFESEATGRENILYRGLMLGRKKGEIKKLEREIVDFADIGEFIDYPIKTYSAGMTVRLAFGISTSVQGDILLLDEVIGAGDMAFFEKAKKRFREMIAKSNILVLATHDIATLREVCNRIVVLEKGRIIFDGDVETGVSIYSERIKG